MSVYFYSVVNWAINVDFRTGKMLFDYEKTNNNLFKPRGAPSFSEFIPRQAPSFLEQSTSQSSIMGSATAATPMPEHFSTTPAWNPLSRTPMPQFTPLTPIRIPSPGIPDPQAQTLTASPHASTSQIAVQAAPQHPLLDTRLVGATLKVIVNGSSFKNKELVVSIGKINDQVVIQYTHYKDVMTLQPIWVTPKYPNPKHDNGYLIIIKGNNFAQN